MNLPDLLRLLVAALALLTHRADAAPGSELPPARPDEAGGPAFVLPPRGQDTPPPSPPPAKAYSRKSLATLSDRDLLRLMGPGRDVHDFENESVTRNHLPPRYWDLPPRQAALALAGVNRTDAHRTRFRLTMADPGADAPPESCTLSVSASSARCYNAIDRHYFLRVDPKASYLAYARAWSGGAVGYNIVHDQPAFDFRFCPLPYEDARHLAATIWWLDRLQSREPDGSFLSARAWSSADGSGAVTLRTGAGAPLIERHETLWGAEHLSERWSGAYDHETFVNFAAYLVTEALTARLGKAWTDAAPRHDQSSSRRQDHGPLYTEEETRRLAGLTQRFLDWFSPRQDRISDAISACAADAAGTLAISEARPRLEKILAALPPDPESGATGAKGLRQNVALALRKIETADDPAALYTWATTEEPGSQWALQQLARLDPPRYIQTLEWWMNHENPRWPHQLFEEIRRIDPSRAAAIAASLPPAKKNALAVSALLQDAGRPGDETERLAALLAVLRAPESREEERRQAIVLLVPPEDPFRYPQGEVDEALLRLLKPDLADHDLNYPLAEACRALARRQRIGTFGRMVKFLGEDRHFPIHDDLLGALVHLSQSDPALLNPRLKALLAPHLAATGKRMNEVLWALWAADLRELRPRLEELGTSDPDDYEDGKATSSCREITPVTGRFHLARKIADTWNADDALTRIRLLTALALDSPHNFVDDSHPERVLRLEAELRHAARSLDAKDRRRLGDFFRTAAETPPRQDPSARQKVVALVRAAIALP